MEQGQIYHMDEVMAAVAEASDRCERYAARIQRQRGQIKELRRENRRLKRERDRACARAPLDAAYIRQLMVAVVGIAVALTCLLHSIVLTGGGF